MSLVVLFAGVVLGIAGFELREPALVCLGIAFIACSAYVPM